jgi:hypothetical protein
VSTVRKGVIATALLVSVVAAALAIQPVQASEWTEGESKIVEKLSEWATKFAKESDKVSPFTKALAEVADKIKVSIATVTDRTFIEPEWLDNLDAQRRAMDQTIPPILPSLNAPGTYRKMVGNIGEPSTYESGAEELRTLGKVGNERADTIAEMKKNRNSLKAVAERYKKESELGHKIGDAYDKVLTEIPHIDTLFAFTGVNGYFSLTVVAWEAEVEPALDGRADAAEKAVARYDIAIKAADSDLKTFNTLKSGFRRMYGMDAAALDTQTLNPASVDMNPGAVGKLLDEANAAATRAQEVANQMEKEAEDISKHNAGISRVQKFTGMMRAAGELGKTFNEPPPSSTTTVQSKTYIDNRKIYFQVVPDQYLQQNRRGQTPISPLPQQGDVEQYPD